MTTLRGYMLDVQVIYARIFRFYARFQVIYARFFVFTLDSRNFMLGFRNIRSFNHIFPVFSVQT